MNAKKYIPYWIIIAKNVILHIIHTDIIVANVSNMWTSHIIVFLVSNAKNAIFTTKTKKFFVKKCYMCYNSDENHCCNCELNYKKIYNHCCCTKLVYIKNANHCCNCNIIYDTNKNHCCKHNILYNINKNHCCDCNTLFDVSKNHCCKHNILYDKKFYHCCECNNLFEHNIKHCCKCKILYSNNHCCICENYESNKNHCEICHFIFDETEYNHCCECMTLYKKDNEHKCNKLKCSIKNILINKQKEKFIDHKFIISPFLNTSKIYNLFMNGIKSLNQKFENIESILSSNNYEIVFHGTNDIDNIISLCCNGWNVDKRGKNGQVHGKGEYFSDLIKTPLGFSQNGAIIIALIPSPNICNKINKKQINDEIYYIVDNEKDKFFCLPIAIMKNKIDIDYISYL